MPSLFVFTSWTVSESATRMPPAGGQPFFSAYQPAHLCSLGSLVAFSLLFLYVHVLLSHLAQCPLTWYPPYP